MLGSRPRSLSGERWWARRRWLPPRPPRPDAEAAPASPLDGLAPLVGLLEADGPEEDRPERERPADAREGGAPSAEAPAHAHRRTRWQPDVPVHRGPRATGRQSRAAFASRSRSRRIGSA